MGELVLIRYVTNMEKIEIDEEDLVFFICQYSDFDEIKILSTIKENPDIIYDVLMDIKDENPEEFNDWIENMTIKEEGQSIEYDLLDNQKYMENI